MASVRAVRLAFITLTAFLPGMFSAPPDLYMHIRVTLPTYEMAKAFANGLKNAGYRSKEINLYHRSVALTFAKSVPPCGALQKLQIRFVQFFNRMFCRTFLFLTKPFRLRADRILYLYYRLPFAFRGMLRLKQDKKRRNLQTKKGARFPI